MPITPAPAGRSRVQVEPRELSRRWGSAPIRADAPGARWGRSAGARVHTQIEFRGLELWLGRSGSGSVDRTRQLGIRRCTRNCRSEKQLESPPLLSESSEGESRGISPKIGPGLDRTTGLFSTPASGRLPRSPSPGDPGFRAAPESLTWTTPALGRLPRCPSPGTDRCPDRARTRR